MKADVVVVGSINHDITVLTARLPQPGETVMGHGHYSGPGGKGANQAVAAARMGADTSFIAKVGDDARGRDLRSKLRAEGIDDSLLDVDQSQPTGLAVITVDKNAENTIVVSPGANRTLSPTDINAAEETIREASVVLAQLEIPLETVEAAASLTRGMFCLNPAPGSRALPSSLLNRVDVLIPNRSELALLSGRPVPESADETVSAVREVRGPNACVVTLGSRGALVVEGDEVTPIDPIEVDAIDPTGAGDAFCGMLAVQLAWGKPLRTAARKAAVAGALAASKKGAMGAMPTAEEVEAATAG